MDSHKLDAAAAHAIHALPADEAARLERQMDADLAGELATFRRVAIALIDGLPDIVPAASPELWDRISQRAGISSSVPPSPVAKTRRTSWSLMAAAAFLAVLAVGAMTRLVTLSTADNIRSTATAAMANFDSLYVTLASPEGVTGIHPEVVIAADGTGFVIADTLPRLTDDRTYQLWVIVEDRVVSVALLGNEPGVVEFRAGGEISGIAISNEIAGGVVASTVAPTAVWLSDSI
jgi:anti-sigma-K factor RskA